MDTFLTLIIAVGGIVTGVAAIWTAVTTRRQASVTEQSLREQNERARLNLEVDLMLRLDATFQSQHLLASRRQAAKYLRDNFIIDGELKEVQDFNRAAWDVMNFFELIGYLVNTGALRVEPVGTAFGEYIQGNWVLYEPVIYKQRAKNGEPDLYAHWEQLSRMLDERARQRGRNEEFMKEELRLYIELESYIGEDRPAQD